MAKGVATCLFQPMSNVAISSITEDEHAALEASCPRRKVDAPFRTPCIPSIKAVPLMAGSRKVRRRRSEPNRTASGSSFRARLISTPSSSPSSKTKRSMLQPLSAFGLSCTSGLTKIDITPPTTPSRPRFSGSFEKPCLTSGQSSEILLRITSG